MSEYIIGVDVGATNTRVCLARIDGTILDKAKFPTPRTGDRLTVARAIHSAIVDRYGKYLDRVSGIGVGTIGPIDLKRGIVVNSPNNPIRTFELREPLMEWTGKPVFVANDCVTAVWGEYLFGAGRGYRNVVYITISTGIGGGAIVNGVLLLGKNGNAHEVGHITVDYNSDIRCNCGAYGHWEAFASGANIPRFARYLMEKHGLEHSGGLARLLMEGRASARDVFEYARRGDKLGRLVVSELARINSAGVASVINVYDPEIVTIGGSVALNNVDLVVDPVKAGVDRYIVTEKPRIMVTPLGDDVVLKGAIALVARTPSTLMEFQS